MYYNARKRSGRGERAEFCVKIMFEQLLSSVRTRRTFLACQAVTSFEPRSREVGLCNNLAKKSIEKSFKM